MRRPVALAFGAGLGLALFSMPGCSFFTVVCGPSNCDGCCTPQGQCLTAHTGGCARSGASCSNCPGGFEPPDGGPRPFARGPAPASGIAADETHLYWVSNGPGGRGLLLRVPLEGGEPLTLASGLTGSPTPSGLAVDSSSVYWIESAGGGSLNQVSKAGGAVTQIAGGFIRSITTDRDAVYWVGTSVMRRPNGGGSPESLGSTLSGWSIAANGRDVYWSEADRVVKRPLDGGSAAVIFSGQGDALELALDDLNLFAVIQYGNKVVKIPFDGSAFTVLANTGGNNIGMDDEYVYFGASGTLSKVPKAGGAPTRLLENPTYLDFVVAGRGIYWTMSDGTVMRTNK